MRFVVAFAAATVMTFIIFWVGANLADLVSGSHAEQNDFTVGRKLMLCGRVIDTRHELSGYDLERWRTGDCEQLSRLEECLLDCLSAAGTLTIGEACYSDCAKQ